MRGSQICGLWMLAAASIVKCILDAPCFGQLHKAAASKQQLYNISSTDCHQ